MDQKEHIFSTQLGDIFAKINKVENTVPVLLLHGVYFDHHLWDDLASHIQDRTVIAVDMPLHGKSKNITKKAWRLHDCATMLLDIIDHIDAEKVFAIGHSWGSMTILRAAARNPEKFQSIGLCNMPFVASTFTNQMQFSVQHLFLRFRQFYEKQVASAIYGKESLKKDPGLLGHLQKSMSQLSNKEIIETDRSVIMHADSALELLPKVKSFALALKGKDDYVPEPPGIGTILVEGGHVSPLETPGEVAEFAGTVLDKKIRKP